jgi:GntR family transcriptional repressor for pyruvate dehydrogenase complex
VTRGNEARRLDFMDAVRLEHLAIVEAIAARDPVAARHRAREHLAHGERRLVEGGVISGQRHKPGPVAAQGSKP